jgi:hypothetical protein
MGQPSPHLGIFKYTSRQGLRLTRPRICVKMDCPRGGLGDLHHTSGGSCFDKWETNLQVLERCCRYASWNEWSQSLAWPIPQPPGRWQRCYHAENLTWQLGLPLSYRGNGVVSALRRGFQLLPAEWRESRIVRPSDRVAKNLEGM